MLTNLVRNEYQISIPAFLQNYLHVFWIFLLNLFQIYSNVEKFTETFFISFWVNMIISNMDLVQIRLSGFANFNLFDISLWKLAYVLLIYTHDLFIKSIIRIILLKWEVKLLKLSIKLEKVDYDEQMFEKYYYNYQWEHPNKGWFFYLLFP